jgi:GT2 family glycosyltransferase
MAKIRCSVVIPHFSNISGLRTLLQSLFDYTDHKLLETIVVANGASEESRMICHEYPVICVWEPQACGFTKATNLGIAKATSEYILLLNDDCQILKSPKNQWLETLLEPFKDERVGMAGVHEIYSHEIRHHFIPFYCAMIRKDVLDRIGPLDEVFNPGFSEDIDWTARMLRAGYRYVNVDPNATQEASQMVGSFPLYHVGSQTFHQTPEKRAAYELIVQRNLATLRERYARLRLLVVLANYGTENLHYLHQVLDRYRSFTNYEVSLVVHSNVPIEGVETVLHTSPPNGSWLNLPWECRKTIYEHRDSYDLYLYSENDHLISERNIDAFAKIELPENMIAGFMRYENSPHGRFYPDYHKHFDWDLNSVQEIGNYTVAKFGNLHQGSFLVTRKQLARAIGPAFLDPNQRQWNSEYDPLARCSTDLYDTGFEKVIPISHFEDFLIHHLPDKYFGVYDTKCDDVMQPMIEQMMEKPRYSIIIPTYKHLDCLIPCCESIKKYTDLSNVEVVIVANGCGSDGTKEYVESLGKPFRLIWFDEAQGFTKATNAGIRAARGEYIIFMNNDVFLTEQTVNGWLDKLQELWDSVPNAGVVGPFVENVFVNNKFVAFYLAMTSRKVIDHIGMLDETAFSSGGEDVDFCIRAQQAGYEIIGNQNVYDEQGNKRFRADFPMRHLGEQTVLENPNFMDDWRASNAVLTERYGTKYSVVIPTYNHCDDLLRPCIESIIQHTDLSRVEIIIVANGCTDNTREYVKSLGHPFKLIWVDEKIGFTKATNLGMKAAQVESKYIVFLNNDTILKGEWIPVLEKAFIDHPDCGMSGPLKFVGEAGKSNDFIMMFCGMVSREAMEKVGYLDELFSPAGVEDIDYGLRLQLAGYSLIQVPEGEAIDRRSMSPVAHSQSSTWAMLPTAKRKAGTTS